MFEIVKIEYCAEIESNMTVITVITSRDIVSFFSVENEFETRMITSISSEALLPFVARPTDKIFVE